MLDLLLFVATVWIAVAAGRNVLLLLLAGEEISALERTLFGFGLGLGLIAAGMLVLGLAGGLYPAANAPILLVLAFAGSRQHRAMLIEVRDAARRGILLSLQDWALIALFAAFAFVPLIGCYAPPTLLEWDSLAYHLADPKLYLQAHHIYYIPWEDHSNFGFTAEMWYLYGMLLCGSEGGVPLAKLFHFACGAGTCLAIYAFAVRHLSPNVGKLAALLFASTPIILWEAGTAYVDLATVFYTMLTLLALGRGMTRPSDGALRLSAILMGLTLTTKATALGTWGLLAIGLFVWHLRVCRQPVVQALRAMVGWAGLALLVGSPWFVKSAVYTGNPIYPFFYGLFGGRGWSVAAAQYYLNWNAGFGMGQGLTDMVLAPWNLTMYLLPGHPTPFLKPFNDHQTEFGALTPMLLAGLFFPVFSRGAPGAVKALVMFALGSGLMWLATMQYVRYLLPALPVLCLLTAWVLARAVAVRWRLGYALAALMSLSLAFSLFLGVLLVRTQAPVVFGREARDDYITRGFQAYPAMRFINTRLPTDSKIVMYGNPLGFYCDRPYVWGEPIHGNYIPYDTFADAEDLRRFLVANGITHILIVPRWFALAPSAPGARDYPGWVYHLTVGSGSPVYSAPGVAVWSVPNRP